MKLSIAPISWKKHFLLFSLIVALLSQMGFYRFWSPSVTLTSAFETGEGSTFRQVSYLLVLLIAIAQSRGPLLKRFILPKTLLIMFAWFALTLTWSPAPEIAGRRLALTMIIVLSIFVVVRSAPVETLIDLLWAALLALAFVGFATVQISPQTGIHQIIDSQIDVVGDWRGLSAHKNIFGILMAYGSLFSLHRIFNGTGRKRQLNVLFFGSFFFLLIMSGSKTSLGVFMLCAGLFLTLNASSQRRSGFRLAIVCLVVLLLTAGLAILTALLTDRDGTVITPESFTNRGLIWTYVWKLYEGHEILGRGYLSVFSVGEDSALIGYAQAESLALLPHAHNAYLEVLVSTGIIGLILMLVACLLAPVAAVAQMDAELSKFRPLFISCLLFSYLHAFLESGLTDRDRTTWVMLLFIYAAASTGHRRNAAV